MQSQNINDKLEKKVFSSYHKGLISLIYKELLEKGKHSVEMGTTCRWSQEKKTDASRTYKKILNF